MTELRLIAKNCSFGELESQLVRDRLVCGTNSEEVRKRLLSVEDLTLDKAISICRAHEETKKNAQLYNDGSTIEVCDLKKKMEEACKETPQTHRELEMLTHPAKACVRTVVCNTLRSNVQHLGSNAANATS